MSGRRRWVFTGLMLAIPVLFFVLLEGGLRLVGYGDDYPLFVPVPGAPGYLVQSDDVARRYFAQQATVPNSIGDQFRAEKPAGALRIFVQGGSSAAGFPFYHGGAFSRVLQQRLQQTLPSREVEVVNTAMAAVGSYTLRDLADEIAEHDPDAVLVYAGHNEYYGALGVGSTESLGRVPWVVNAYLGLRGLRTVQLLRGALVGVTGLFSGAPEAGERPSNTLMGQMVGEQTIPYGSEVYAAGLRQFRTNLSALLAMYEDAGIPVFVGTLASNERDQAPFVSVHALADREAWQTRVREGADAYGRGDLDAAEDAFRAAVALDTLAADAYYGLGRVLERAGRADEARIAFLAAKDRDALRFRAPEAFNTIVREEAAAHGATVVDVQGALRARAPGGAIGREHMLEHLHPTLDGYFLIADAFYDALLESPVVGEGARPVPEEAAYAERLVTAVDSLVGVLRVRRLMSEWPFQPLGTRLQLDTLTGPSPVDQMAWRLYKGETDWLSAAQWLADHYSQRGQLERALRVHLAVAQELPSRAEPRTAAGNVLMAMGRPAEAAPFFEAAIAREPDAAAALGMLGAIRLSEGQRPEAVRLLERAHQLAPTNTQFLYNLAGAYALTDRIEDARRAAREVLRLDPDHVSARMLLQSLPPA